MLRQIQFGMTDMQLHSRYDPSGSETAFDVFQRISDATSPMPALPENRFLCSFQHIFAGGYSAGYYSYLWSDALTADAVDVFEKAGGFFDPTVAKSLHDNIFSVGDTVDPADGFRMFRGRDVDTSALLRKRGFPLD